MSENIDTNDFPSVDWDDGKVNLNESLHLVFTWTTGEAKAAINYYITKTKWNKWIGRKVRLVSAILVAFAAVLPTVSELYTNSAGKPKLPPVYATLVAAVAAALFGLDRTLGWSNAWIRYMKTATTIHTLLDDFNLQWAKAKVLFTKNGFRLADAPQMIDLAKDYVDKFNKAIETETKAWISDYKKASAEFAKILEEATGTGDEEETEESKAGEPVEIADTQYENKMNIARRGLILEGEGKVTISGKDTSVVPGDTFEIPADTPFNITKSPNAASLKYILAEKDTA